MFYLVLHDNTCLHANQLTISTSVRCFDNVQALKLYLSSLYDNHFNVFHAIFGIILTMSTHFSYSSSKNVSHVGIYFYITMSCTSLSVFALNFAFFFSLMKSAI